MQSILVIRADSNLKLDMSINNVSRRGMMIFEDDPKRLEPDYADQILVNVMKTELRNPCSVAAIVPLKNQPSDAIEKLKMINPPAHLIIVSSRHNIYATLMRKLDSLVYL